MHIVADDLTGHAIRTLLEDHLRDMHAQSPPESVHAMDVARLRRPDVSFWSAWDGEALLGCAALRELDAIHGEVKSMRTAPASRGRGVARALLAHVVAEARARGYARLSLETGSQPGFEPARRLYASLGFERCAPFGEYVEDPYSVFMTLVLRA
jgi:putative acetyltransferase